VGNGAKRWKAAGTLKDSRGANHCGGRASERVRRKGIEREKRRPEVENFPEMGQMFHVERSTLGEIEGLFLAG
jgi:hypothetical protein